MRPAEIIADECYFNACHWKFRVDRINRQFGTINYTVLSGPMSRRSGITTIDEFAERMAGSVALPKSRLTIEE
jgi:hypothetical protein